MKKKTMFVIILLIFSIMQMGPAIGDTFAPQTDWIIDGDKVYVNDSEAYISAEPHTITAEGWVVFEAMRKAGPTQMDIDFCWGFNGTEAQPKCPQLWKNYTHTLIGWHWIEKWANITIYNITDNINLGIENYDNYNVTYGNANNTKLYMINFTDPDNGELSVIIAFTEWDIQGTTCTFSGNHNFWESYTYQENFWDWWDIPTNRFTHIEYTYQNMTDWWAITDVTTTKNVLYTARAWIKFPFGGFEEMTGKYWWVSIPSGKTIAEAIAEGTFYCLDPWYSSQFQYRKLITVNHSMVDTDFTNFPILFHVSSDSDLVSHAQDDGDDILFVLYSDNTKLNHELELYNSTSGEIVVWVNVTNLSSSVDTKIWMYYGNATCNSQENIDGTWNSNYMLVQHLNETSGIHYDSTNNNNDGIQSGGVNQSAIGMVDGADWFDGSNDFLDCGDGDSLDMGTGDFTVEVWVKTTETNNRWITGKHNPANLANVGYDLEIINGKFKALIDSSATGGGVAIGPGTTIINDNNWHYLVAVFDRNNKGMLYVDKTVDNEIDITGQSNNISNNINQSIAKKEGIIPSYFKGTIDEVRISNIIRNSSWINTSYNAMKNQGVGDGKFIKSLGNEEQEAQASISISPSSIDFGIVAINSFNLTNDYYFNLTNDGGATVDVIITINNSNNWTFVNYTNIGHDQFAMNWSDDNWSSESNIKVGGTILTNNLIASDYYLFDLKILTPTTISKIGNGEEIVITLTATAV